VPKGDDVRRVILVAFPAVEILDLAGPVQVFDEARRSGAAYELLYCGTRPRLRTDQGLWLGDLAPLPAVEASDLVLVPGFRMAALREAERGLSRWLRAAAATGAHLASVCTGAFLLGSAGLLDGRQCTTHWSRVEELQQRFPAARVLSERLFVTDGPITTSAGIASGIDMALALVERHHGPQIASAVAREMVVYLRRDGSQRQQSIYLDYRSHLHPGVHRVQDWLLAHAAQPATLSELARVGLMSPRHLTRLFRQATGISIRAFVTRLRLERAAVLLHDPGLSLEAVARRSGFGSARQLRRCWRHLHGAPPSALRGSAGGAFPARTAPPRRLARSPVIKRGRR
jgi:transcriptional regulator GlxA family with amidase domain